MDHGKLARAAQTLCSPHYSSSLGSSSSFTGSGFCGSSLDSTKACRWQSTIKPGLNEYVFEMERLLPRATQNCYIWYINLLKAIQAVHRHLVAHMLLPVLALTVSVKLYLGKWYLYADTVGKVSVHSHTLSRDESSIKVMAI